ncbi:MAG: glycine--tRNA ligase subunit alpha [Candidatus Orphnella occulta]|nr:glycine--tRNA ligase subunit alpha [Candidatus Orphnella occulta]MDP8297171.1 glycine--tRNA ligase subunit alpha [Candidatus Orphnella occulta]
MYFQDIIERLNKFWNSEGAVIALSYDIEVGAGTFHPLTFFKCLDNKPWKVGYVQPSRRPADGRYADNPLRMQRYYQYQVIVKPAPSDIQDLYIRSLKSIGINPKAHDIRFVEDDWESPTLGASGLGWEVWLDSLEITQFTYFQQLGGFELKTIPCEITYGLERIAMFLQDKDSAFELQWNKNTTYGQMHTEGEKESSEYNFEALDPTMAIALFDMYEKESQRLIKDALLLPAYEYMLKSSHVFNMLDARGVISATERATYIGRVRDLAKNCAKVYMKRQGLIKE